ncbi:MAG: murein L,D-transpeptidase catalytic domain family protein [Cyclobacteriaceae bacterium]|nr:murein L,D-transpeptidase catalytic domain family protein [Cyclobacteriaceae bacterium]
MNIRYVLFFVLAMALIRPCLADGPESPNGSTSTFFTAKSIYQSLRNERLSFEAFQYAFEGYRKLLDKNILEKANIITLIDFDKASNEDRFFIIDVKNFKILFESLVAHGRNSGDEIATSFSNLANSYKSSLGFYLTGETYTGQHGLSLKLDGLEPGINDNARARNIVIHSADYVSQSFIEKNGRLGRSFGCPSLPAENYNAIIDTIKGKSLLFIYSGKADYLNKSDYL